MYVHVCRGPPSFAIFDFGVCYLLFQFLFASDLLHNVLLFVCCFHFYFYYILQHWWLSVSVQFSAAILPLSSFLRCSILLCCLAAECSRHIMIAKPASDVLTTAYSKIVWKISVLTVHSRYTRQPIYQYHS